MHVNPNRPSRQPAVSLDRRWHENLPILNRLLGYHHQPGEPFTYSTENRRYRLTTEEERDILFKLVVKLAGRVHTDTWRDCVGMIATENVKLLRAAEERAERREALVFEIQEAQGLSASRDTNDPAPIRARLAELLAELNDLDRGVTHK